MSVNILLDYFILSVFLSLAVNYIARDFARKKNLLVDLPDKSRKFHKRATPLTGGISILAALLISGKLYIDLNNLNGFVPEFTYYLMLSSIPLVLVFLIDDFKNLKASQRLLIQSFFSIYMIYTTGIHIESFGNLFGLGVINLGIFSIPVTVFCIVGIMNAFNMIDGVNGLCSGYSMISLLLMSFYSGLIYDSMMILIIGSIVGFLIFNLRIFGKKRGVFLGDNGSNLIGFWVAWSAIYCSQNELYEVEPITMIWFVAIPFLDCIGLIFARIRKGINVSSPGRDHVHHKLMEKYSPEATLIIILAVALFTGSLGIFLDNNYSAWVSTYLFILYSMSYFIIAYRLNFTKTRLSN